MYETGHGVQRQRQLIGRISVYIPTTIERLIFEMPQASHQNEGEYGALDTKMVCHFLAFQLITKIIVL